MALIKCPICEEEISIYLQKCPHCEHKMDRSIFNHQAYTSKEVADIVNDFYRMCDNISDKVDSVDIKIMENLNHRMLNIVPVYIEQIFQEYDNEDDICEHLSKTIYNCLDSFDGAINVLNEQQNNISENMISIAANCTDTMTMLMSIILDTDMEAMVQFAVEIISIYIQKYLSQFCIFYEHKKLLKSKINRFCKRIEFQCKKHTFSEDFSFNASEIFDFIDIDSDNDDDDISDANDEYDDNFSKYDTLVDVNAQILKSIVNSNDDDLHTYEDVDHIKQSVSDAFHSFRIYIGALLSLNTSPIELLYLCHTHIRELASLTQQIYFNIKNRDLTYLSVDDYNKQCFDVGLHFSTLIFEINKHIVTEDISDLSYIVPYLGDAAMWYMTEIYNAYAYSWSIDRMREYHNIYDSARSLVIKTCVNNFHIDYIPVYNIHNKIHSDISSNNSSANDGCYIATAVYGSYDCPEVWTLRRFRDHKLALTKCGRSFIRFYYSISPTLVRNFGQQRWFTYIFHRILDLMVCKLNGKGIENTPYKDINWVDFYS